MDTTLNKDARGLVDGVVTALRHESRAGSVVPKVKTLLSKLTTQTKKEKVARVESSVLLNGSEKETIQKFLAKLLGHEVDMECTVNPDLLAGLRIQVGDWVLDTTLKEQLEQMAEVLKK